MVYISVLGYGTVGSGVVEVLKQNKDIAARHAGQEIEVKYVLDLRDFPGDPVQEKIVHDFDIILNDPEVEIVVEVLGGVEPAYTFTNQALCAGKSVVTSNKELVAKHGAALMETAKAHRTNFLFEASVGGGIPIIRALYASLTADHITEISGIMNGTTNYILTKMYEEGAQFADVLSQAQAYGYAERDPSADVDGYDACRKIAILTSLTNEQSVNYEDIYTEGIRKISAEDIRYIKQMGRNVRLLACARKNEQGMYAMVAPFLLEPAHPLFHVNDVFNAVYIDSDMLGATMFYGKGAGKLPTASAVVSDVIDAVKHKGALINMNLPAQQMRLLDFDSFVCPFFVRVRREDLSEIRKRLPVAQELEPLIENEAAFITEPVSQAAFRAAEDQVPVINRIRIYT